MGAVVHPFLVLRVHLKWSRASSEGILNCWKGRAKCVFQQNFLFGILECFGKYLLFLFIDKSLGSIPPPHRITNHHRDVVWFLGVGNPKLNLKKKLLECWVFGVDPTNHGWFSEIFFRLTFRNISHIPLKIAAWKRPCVSFAIWQMVPSCGCILHFFGWVPGPARFFGSRGLSPGQREA